MMEEGQDQRSGVSNWERLAFGVSVCMCVCKLHRSGTVSLCILLCLQCRNCTFLLLKGLGGKLGTFSFESQVEADSFGFTRALVQPFPQC